MGESGNRSWQESDSGFRWQASVTGPILTCSAISEQAHAIFTSRHLEFRAETLDQDYAAVAGILGVSPGALIRVRQVHGREIVVITPDGKGPAPGEVAADAIVSMNPTLVPSVRVADCVPVLLADRRQRVVAAVHAGWRGTAAGVAHETVQRIRSLGVAPEDLVAAIGPSIGPCCYQVDRTVVDRMSAAWSDVASWFTSDGVDHWKLDLWRANRAQLEAAGVPSASIAEAGICTFDHVDLCHSFRRDGEPAGRMVAAVRLRS